MTNKTIEGVVPILVTTVIGGALFHLADQPSVSTSEIAALVRQGMGRKARLFSAPWLVPHQLSESLEIDTSAFREAFGYSGADSYAALIACGEAWRGR